MDRCSYGGDDDVGVGEGGIMAERMEKGQHVRCRAAPVAAHGDPPAPAGHHGGAPPLGPFLHGFLVL